MKNKKSKLQKWKLLKSKNVFSSKWMNILNNTYQLPNGKIAKNYFHLDRPDYVLIVAHKNKNQILLIKTYRRGIDDFVYELPAGWVEQGENTTEAALRELKEETGYTGNGKVLSTIYPQPGFSSMKAIIISIEINNQTSQNLEEDENLTFEFKTLTEINNLIKNQILKDMGLISAIKIYELSL